jgi:hypothetical protein
MFSYEIVGGIYNFHADEDSLPKLATMIRDKNKQLPVGTQNLEYSKSVEDGKEAMEYFNKLREENKVGLRSFVIYFRDNIYCFGFSYDRNDNNKNQYHMSISNPGTGLAATDEMAFMFAKYFVGEPFTEIPHNGVLGNIMKLNIRHFLSKEED